MNFGSKFVFPGGGSSMDCPTIYDFEILEMNTCSCIAVGTTYPAGDYTFVWKYYEQGKVLLDTITIRDNSTVPVTDLIINGPIVDPISLKPEMVVTIPYDITLDAVGKYRFTVMAQGDCGGLADTADIEFCLPVFSEGNPNPALTGAEIPTTLSPKITNRYPGTYGEFGTGYKYFALPVSMMETDALSTQRPNIVFDPVRLCTDFVDPEEEMIEFDSTTTFNPMYVMENSYSVNIQWGAGPLYAYNVFRSTNIMHNPMTLEVQDHL